MLYDKIIFTFIGLVNGLLEEQSFIQLKQFLDTYNINYLDLVKENFFSISDFQEYINWKNMEVKK